MERQNIEETLEEVLIKMRTRKVVSNILEAKDVKSAYHQQTYAMESRLQKFKSEMLHFIKINKAPFEVLPDFITSKNIVDLCFLFIMTGIDDEDIVEDSQEIAKMLMKVDGKLQGVAHKIFEVFYNEEHRKMSEYSYEYFLKMIVLL